MIRVTGAKQYGQVEGVLLTLIPYALLMARNHTAPFPWILSPLAAFFTIGCGLVGARLLFRNMQYGKLCCWLCWGGALIGSLPVLFDNPFKSLTIAAFLILTCFFLIDFKINFQEILALPPMERSRLRSIGSAQALGGAWLLSLWLNPVNYLEMNLAFTSSALVSLWLWLRWMRFAPKKNFNWIYCSIIVILILLLLSSLILDTTRGAVLLVALFISITLYHYHRTAVTFEQKLELILNNPSRTLFSTFFTLCIFGLILLNFSFATARNIPLIDKLFTAVSAVCVTGLSVLDISKEFTFVGQIFIMLLIQLGGLGIMTIATAAMFAFGKRISLSQERLMNSLTDSDHQDLIYSLKLILKFTFIIEGVGALLLMIGFMRDGLPWAIALWQGCFTAISAFCNAGFTLYSTNLMSFAHNPIVLYTVSALVIAGGIAPASAIFLPAYFLRKPIPITAHLAITTTLVLLLIGTGATLFFEWNNALTDLEFTAKINNAWFQSVTVRTAGFNSIDVARISTPTYIIFLFLMFIGGSPGGTAGGIKTSTLAILAITFWHNVIGSENLNIQNRHIRHQIVYRALTIVVASGLVGLVALLMLTITQSITPREILFETTSALGTVGLSLGATAKLDSIGKILIILTMFIGRIGPLTIFLLLGGTSRQTKAHYPDAKITLN